MKDWLEGGGSLPREEFETRRSIENDLREDLIATVYFFTPSNKILLERKEDMKARGVASPDLADALALTFAFPVVPKAAARAKEEPYSPFQWRKERRRK